MSDRAATFDVESCPDQAAFVAGLPIWLSESLPAFLPDNRWFGDKAKTIASVEITQLIPVETIGVPAAVAIATVHFAHRETATYLLPVALSRDAPATGRAIVDLRTSSERCFVIDGLENPAFRAWFAESIAGNARDSRLKGDRLATMQTSFDAAAVLPSRLLGVDQSNSSIAFGFDMLIKVLRRLQPGIHPDVELTRFLTAKTSFTNIAHYFGSLAVTAPDGTSSVVAFAQRFIESSGDGWTYLLNVIRSHIEATSIRPLLAASEPIASRLGQVTAAMHLALASDPWTSDIAPETIKRSDAEHWSAGYISLIDRVAADLSDHQHRFDPATRELVQTFLELAPGLRKRDAGFQRLIGRSKTRVHGDYHLGQTLRTADDDFVVIDFEGEPLRTIEERRQKTSPLKDVAGMLRSFSYARGTANSWLTEASGLLSSDLVSWERSMRAGFLGAYVKTVTAGGGTFLPTSPEDLRAALTAWELDKAAYEVIYELNNRPDWLWIPLSSMLKQAEPEPPEHIT